MPIEIIIYYLLFFITYHYYNYRISYTLVNYAHIKKQYTEDAN